MESDCIKFVMWAMLEVQVHHKHKILTCVSGLVYLSELEPIHQFHQRK